MLLEERRDFLFNVWFPKKSVSLFLCNPQKFFQSAILTLDKGTRRLRLNDKMALVSSTVNAT